MVIDVGSLQSSGGCRFNPDCRQVTIQKYLYLVMVIEIKASEPHELNKGRGSKFHVSSQAQQETPEEGWWTHHLKHYEYNNKDEDNSPKTLNDKNYKRLFKELLRDICLKESSL